jgi:hypothetical protein
VVITNEAGDPVYRKGMWLMLAGIKPHCFCKLAEIYFVVYMFKYTFPVCQS